MSTLLFAPPGFWCLTPAGKQEFCNGCGARWSVNLVPDSIWGLSITEACNVHDYTYQTCEGTIEAKESADRAFLNNMLRLITDAGGWLQGVRTRTAYGYYCAVVKFGGPDFWKYHNKPEEGGYV